MSLPHCIRALEAYEDDERTWQAALSPFQDPRMAFARFERLQQPSLEERAAARAAAARKS